MAIEVRSEAFGNGDRIPTRYSQDGENVSPPLRFENLPDEAKELALIVDDPDAPMDEPYVHWVIYRIAGDLDRLPEGVATSPKPDQPIGAYQGPNSAGSVGYDGPAPPEGHGTHHYYFKLYALDEELNLEPGADKKALLEAMEDHIIDQGELVGTYER